MSAVDPARLGLVVVTSRGIAPGDPLAALAGALAGGASAIQLREKDLGAADLLDIATSIRALTSEHGGLLLVNDRLDVALAADADGVHLGWRSLPTAAARRVVGDRMLVGRSTHSAEEAARAVGDGADYVVFGPVYATPSKEGLVEPRGLAGLAEAVRAAGPAPVIAIGGIDGKRARDVLDAGASGIAVIRAVLAASDPRAAAADLAAIVGSRAARGARR